jgi:hypothetical protein
MKKRLNLYPSVLPVAKKLAEKAREDLELLNLEIL